MIRPGGDSTRHRSFAELERGLEAMAPPRDAALRDSGRLALIVVRGADGQRDTPEQVILTREEGVPGDAWFRKSPGKTNAQVTMMRLDVARLIANGQPLSLFGDNLFVDLDISAANLPAGSRLRAGAALLEVTRKPHTGCFKFRERFGADALRLTADPRFQSLRLRGVYVKVVEDGPVACGDSVTVLSRRRPARVPSPSDRA
jgi:MOSC domain-containing protein YiiM